MTPSTTLTRLLLPLCIVLQAEADLRPLSTDRPDTTESPHTVDAGHFQVEMELAAWTKDANRSELTLGELNMKYGLSPSTDLQLVLPFFTRIRHGEEGFGDIQVRMKHNIWGNDDGTTALAIMPFIKLPTASGGLGNQAFEGGLIFPFGIEGPRGWAYGLQGELDLIADDSGDHHFSFLSSATASHAITEATGAFVEFVGIIDTQSGSQLEAYFNIGGTWLATPQWQLDGGVRVGLTDSATDLTPFFGFSTKF